MRKRSQPTDPSPEFFCDRGLGKRVYEALEADGWIVYPMFKVWPRSENKRLDDAWWIPRVAERGWAILAKDEFNKGRERELVRDNNARAFSIFSGGLKAEMMIERFRANRDEIFARASLEAGPYLYAVQTNKLHRTKLP